MAITAAFRKQIGTKINFKPSGGTAVMTAVSIANSTSDLTGAQQSAKADFGATQAQLYAVYLHIEFAATPTAQNEVGLWFNPSSSASAGTDEHGGCGGSSAAYTGYSNNIASSLRQLVQLGPAPVTVQVTPTVQHIFVGYVTLPSRYGSVVMWNKSGAATHSSDSNFEIEFVPQEFTSEAS